MPLDIPIGTALPEGDDPFAMFNTSSSPILFPVGERPVYWIDRHKKPHLANTHKSIIRTNAAGDGGQLLNIVGADYKLVHNKDLFTRVEQTMKNQMLPEHLHTVQVTDKVSGFGRVCYRQYVFPDIKCKISRSRLTDAQTPFVAFRIIVQNGYGGSALRLYAGAIDFYCSNGMIRGDYSSTYKKHTKGLVIEGLDKTIEQALLGFSQGTEEWSRWAYTPLHSTKAKAFLETLAISPKLREHLIAQYLRETDVRGNNLWALYSSLTYYASHGDVDGEFKMRSSVIETNTEAHTMLQREIKVSRWTQTNEWKELENA